MNNTARLLAILLFFPCIAYGEWVKDHADIMGTRVSVELWEPLPGAGRQLIADVFSLINDVDQQFSPYKEASELAKVNRSASSEVIKISQPFNSLIDKSLYYSRISKGAFDITFASVGFYYDYREKIKPDTAQREKLLDAVNYQLIQLDRDKSTVSFKDPRVKIDLGGIAKGYAVDQAAALLKQRGVEHAVISAGGDSYFVGDKRGKPWIVGIRHPRKTGENALVVPMSDYAMSTSGDYERFFIDEETGERVHHIIQPKTGKSARGLISVTVIGPNGFDTDPLSTTVFILGVDKGLSLLNRMPGFDGVLIDSEGKVHFSDGLVEPSKVNDGRH